MLSTGERELRRESDLLQCEGIIAKSTMARVLCSQYEVLALALRDLGRQPPECIQANESIIDYQHHNRLRGSCLPKRVYGCQEIAAAIEDEIIHLHSCLVSWRRFREDVDVRVFRASLILVVPMLMVDTDVLVRGPRDHLLHVLKG